MLRFALVFLVLIGVTCDAFSATRATGRAVGRAVSRTSGDASVGTTGTNTTTASVVSARSARNATVAARGGVVRQNAGGGVVARAGVAQKVPVAKVAGAGQNVTISEDCRLKYEGCMDSFCMIENESGGRCLCSDKKATYDKILSEIEKLDQQSYKIATTGVERVEMGEFGDYAISDANDMVDEIVNGPAKRKASKSGLDISKILAESSVEENIFSDVFDGGNGDDLTSKKGDDLHAGAAQFCVSRIPECASDATMLQMMYAQHIKSDCAAYENALKQKRNESAQRLNVAERSLREAALDQLHSANKYNLGECTIEFKKCMQTTAECGEDFSKCATMSLLDATSTRKSSKSARNSVFKIQGEMTNIEISATTYDTLIAKKPLCESVTKSCTLVADQVWDTFLKEVAPQLKNAEIIAEDNARQNCIVNISDCFKQACKDSIDPKDPEGSYDMCLTRPGAMLSLCKVPLDNCGIDTTSEAKAEESNVWEFIVARLASMRVNSCTADVKECLEDKDRCGSDYTQCIGMDTDTILHMCPYDKLVGCQKVYKGEDIRGDKVYDELSLMVQGIMLEIDNNMLTECQNAANEAMIRVCGEVGDCKSVTTSETIGATSLEYKICEYVGDEKNMSISYSACRNDISQIQDVELGRVDFLEGRGGTTRLGPVKPFAGVMDGVIYWESVEVNEDGKIVMDSDYKELLEKDQKMSAEQKERVLSELKMLQDNIDMVVQAIETDPYVEFCRTGRDVQGMRVKQANGQYKEQKVSMKDSARARFPKLTHNMRNIIANAALKKAKDNYYKRYEELNEKMMRDYVKIGERMAEIQGENAKDVRRDKARIACINFADSSVLPKTPAPKAAWWEKVAAGVTAAAIVTVAAVAAPFTGGASTIALGVAITAAGGAIGALVADAMIEGGDIKQGADGQMQLDLVGSKQLNQWNYKETITTTFDWESLTCERCVRSQNCTSTKKRLFGSRYCKSWGDPVEECKDIQF